MRQCNLKMYNYADFIHDMKLAYEFIRSLRINVYSIKLTVPNIHK